MQEPAGPQPQKRLKFLAKKLTTSVTTDASLLMPDMELASYIVKYPAGKITTNGLEFWQKMQLIYLVLAPLALVLISIQLQRSILKEFLVYVATSVHRSGIECQEILIAVFLKMNNTVL